MVIAVFGLPGSGKSYFATHLVDKINANYISSDITRQELFTVNKYTAKDKLRVYDEMIIRMEASINKKENVLLDATFFSEDIRGKFIKAAKELGEPVLFIEIQAEEEIIKERLSKKRIYSDADYSVYLNVKDTYQPLKTEHLILQSDRNNINDMLDKALEYLRDYNE